MFLKKNIMKYYSLLTTAILLSTSLISQTVKPTNVYSTNLEENMYFDKYDDATKMVTGIHFLILSDGDNSKDVTPAFTVKLYLLPEGKTSREDLIIIKTFELDGIYHMGSKEYKNIQVDLSKIKDLKSGTYRMGIWVNADASFIEDTSDNAYLFQKSIRFTAPLPSSSINTSNESKDTKEKEEDKDDDWFDDLEEDAEF
jgi:hypothetical protein